ncbi:MAG: TonB-dependent receptor [Cytophagaceae bacterium]|nr:TonB-dependent receptor [Cytophagaceae bacterium]
MGSLSQQETDNPFFTIYKNRNGDNTNRTIANVQLNYNPTPWLNVIGRFGADIYATQSNLFLHPESWQGDSTAPPLGGYTARGSVENANENSQLLNGNLLATVKKDFGKLRTSLLLGTTVDDRNYKVLTAYGERLYLPEYNSLNNSDPTTQRTKFTQRQQRLFSVLGNLSLNYDDLLILTLTGRNDWSSTLPVANRSFFYPSAALAFNVSDLGSLKGNLGPVDYLKLRASYGQTGRDAQPYLVQSSLTPQTTTGGGFAYGFFGGNPGLKPERGESYELGTEAEFLRWAHRAGFCLLQQNPFAANRNAVPELRHGLYFRPAQRGDVQQPGRGTATARTTLENGGFRLGRDAQFHHTQNER